MALKQTEYFGSPLEGTWVLLPTVTKLSSSSPLPDLLPAPGQAGPEGPQAAAATYDVGFFYAIWKDL